MSVSDDESADQNNVTVEFVVKLPSKSSLASGGLTATKKYEPLSASQSKEAKNPERPGRRSPGQDTKEQSTLLARTSSLKHKSISSCFTPKTLDSADIVRWKAQLAQSVDSLKNTQTELQHVQTAHDAAVQELESVRNELQRLQQSQQQRKQEWTREQRKWQENAVDWKHKADANADQLQQIRTQLRLTDTLIQSKTKSLEEAKERERKLSEECASRALRTQLVETQLAKTQQQLGLVRAELEELQSGSREQSGQQHTDPESVRLRKELEANARNLRVLTTRLSRLERQLESQKNETERLNAENNRLHVQLRRCGEQMLMRSRPATPSEQELRAQLEIARDVLLKMHSAMQTVKGEKIRLHEQLQQAKVDILSAHLALKQSPNKGTSSPAPSEDTNTSDRTAAVAASSGATSASTERREVDQLLADLQASSERESDLQEQLQFSERDADSSRRKLAALEQENELLSVQLRKLCISGSSAVVSDVSGDKNSRTSENALNEQKLLDQLKEEELRLLGSRLNETEKSVQRLQHLLDEAQRKLADAATESERSEQLRQRWNRLEQAVRSETPENSVHLFYQQKIEMLEQETREMRRRLLTSDQQRHSMQQKLSTRNARKPPIAVKTFTRSSSLHS